MRRAIARILSELEEALVAEGFSEEDAKELVDSFEAAIEDSEESGDEAEGN